MYVIRICTKMVVLGSLPRHSPTLPASGNRRGVGGEIRFVIRVNVGQIVSYHIWKVSRWSFEFKIIPYKECLHL